jgi:hypothetical protein
MCLLRKMERKALSHTLDFEKQQPGQAPVAYAYNPSYSGGRDQEDHGSKPAWRYSLQDSI